MSLLSNQNTFALNVAQFIVWLNANYYKATFGEAYRPQEMQDIYFKKGLTKKKYGKHQDRLAIDLNIFRDGKLLTSAQELKLVGTKWQSMNKSNRWGGDWNGNGSTHDETFEDPNHFEMLNT